MVQKVMCCLPQVTSWCVTVLKAATVICSVCLLMRMWRCNTDAGCQQRAASYTFTVTVQNIQTSPYPFVCVRGAPVSQAQSTIMWLTLSSTDTSSDGSDGQKERHATARWIMPSPNTCFVARDSILQTRMWACTQVCVSMEYNKAWRRRA